MDFWKNSARRTRLDKINLMEVEETIKEVIKKRQLKRFRHLCRMNDTHIPCTHIHQTNILIFQNWEKTKRTTPNVLETEYIRLGGVLTSQQRLLNIDINGELSSCDSRPVVMLRRKLLSQENSLLSYFISNSS